MTAGIILLELQTIGRPVGAPRNQSGVLREFVILRNTVEITKRHLEVDFTQIDSIS